MVSKQSDSDAFIEWHLYMVATQFMSISFLCFLLTIVSRDRSYCCDNHTARPLLILPWNPNQLH